MSNPNITVNTDISRNNVFRTINDAIEWAKWWVRQPFSNYATIYVDNTVLLVFYAQKQIGNIISFPRIHDKLVVNKYWRAEQTEDSPTPRMMRKLGNF